MSALTTSRSPLTATIDLDSLQHNLGVVRQAAPNSRVIAMVKANAYGHGLIPAVKSLGEADALGIARLDEALLIRDAGIDQRIVLLSASLNTEEITLCSQQQIDVVIHNDEGLNTLLSSNLTKPFNIWLKIDTGMHRLGFSPNRTLEICTSIKGSPSIANLALMTHFHSADETLNTGTQQQLEQFTTATQSIDLPASMANSAAILAWPQTHKEWVRPGIMLYGSDPLDRANQLSKQLKPVMELSTSIISIRKVLAKESVGYNATWHSARDSIIGTLAIGYADGYPRHATNGTPVLINGERVPLVGRVSMDMITVDLTDHTNVNIGDRAILWGKKLSVKEVAEHSNTIAYDLLTGVGNRVDFVYQG